MGIKADSRIYKVRIGDEEDVKLFISGGEVILWGDGWKKSLATYGTNKQNRLCSRSFLAGIITGLKLAEGDPEEQDDPVVTLDLKASEILEAITDDF